MDFKDKLQLTIQALKDHNIDGWLIYHFQNQNPLAIQFLDIKNKPITRRCFYWINKEGAATLIIHEMEEHLLSDLPGDVLKYSSFKQLDEILKQLMKKRSAVAMEYSPQGMIPYLSRVDKGTIEWIESLGPDVISSATLLEEVQAKLSDDAYLSHKQAALNIYDIYQSCIKWIRDTFDSNKQVYEADVIQYITDQFHSHQLEYEHDPICAFGKNSANPHYECRDRGETLSEGDIVLLDMFAKKPNGIYADFTFMNAFGHANQEQKKIFDIVMQAQKQALSFIQKRLDHKEVVKGFEVDEICRDFIKEEGYADFFIHRAGHNIASTCHGNGAHLDSYETIDDRPLLACMLFSLEPAIYLPRRFGIRLETNFFISHDYKLKTSLPLQTKLTQF